MPMVCNVPDVLGGSGQYGSVRGAHQLPRGKIGSQAGENRCPNGVHRNRKLERGRGKGLGKEWRPLASCVGKVSSPGEV